MFVCCFFSESTVGNVLFLSRCPKVCLRENGDEAIRLRVSHKNGGDICLALHPKIPPAAAFRMVRTGSENVSNSKSRNHLTLGPRPKRAHPGSEWSYSKIHQARRTFFHFERRHPQPGGPVMNVTSGLFHVTIVRLLRCMYVHTAVKMYSLSYKWC